MITILINGLEVNYEPSLLSPAALVQEVLRCRDEKLPWFYNRDILCSAMAQGLITIVTHAIGNPFWWNTFASSVTFTPVMQAILDRQNQHGGH